MNREEKWLALTELIDRPLFDEGMKPLSDSILVHINLEGDVFSLTKQDAKPTLSDKESPNPNLSFTLSMEALERLKAEPNPTVGSTGIAIIKLLVHSDPKIRAGAKVHIGLFDLARLGYLSVLASGGAPLMKFLSSYGLSGMGKIRSAIEKFRDKK